jgi:hypothetical protein
MGTASTRRESPAVGAPVQVVVYHNIDACFRPYRAGHRLIAVVRHWHDQSCGDPVTVADWAFRVFGNDPDLKDADPSTTAPTDSALLARAYRLMGHRAVSVGDVVAVSIGSRRHWLACDPTGWRAVAEPTHVSSVPLSDQPRVEPTPERACPSSHRS